MGLKGEQEMNDYATKALKRQTREFGKAKSRILADWRYFCKVFVHLKFIIMEFQAIETSHFLK
jgi:hypothetical protein